MAGKPSLALVALLVATLAWEVGDFEAPGFAAPLASLPKHHEPDSLLRAYLETIPGTGVQLVMIPVVVGESRGERRSDTLARFSISQTELTWEAFEVWAFQRDLASEQQAAAAVDAISRPTKPYGAPDRGFGYRGYPAIGMTFHAASEFCRWLSLMTGKRFRLPTAVEWELACRAGTAAARDPDSLGAHAWYRENAGNQTQPVGAKRANAWGLHDMLGNVAEWVVGPDSVPMIAGGSFEDSSESVHCSVRAIQHESWNERDPQWPKSKWWLSDAPFVGFRIVRELP